MAEGQPQEVDFVDHLIQGSRFSVPVHYQNLKPLGLYFILISFINFFLPQSIILKKIKKIIGMGAQGHVCSAVDARTGAQVAIKKILNPFYNAETAKRFD